MKGGYKAKAFVHALSRKRSSRGWFSAARPQGYTIIEVMIVLAVTGAIFVSAAVLISGRQQQTEFNQSIREVRSQIQQVVNEVTNGFYPSRGNFTCQVTGNGSPSFTISSGGQGTNEGCVFLGKAIQFGVEDTDPEQFRIITIAGRQKAASSGDEVASLAEAQPIAVAPNGGSVTVDATTDEFLLYGLSTEWADTGVIAFVASLSDINSTTGASIQQINVIPVNNTSLNMSETVAVQAINANLASSPQDPANGVRLCFVSGGTNQSGLITIGGIAGSLSVSMDIKSNRDCS